MEKGSQERARKDHPERRSTEKEQFSHGGHDTCLRLRDEALLALLIYVGLRIQEACDVQVRDIDTASGTLIVRSGKGGKARRLPLHPDAQHIIEHYLHEVRCPAGMPAIGSDQEREAFLFEEDLVARSAFGSPPGGVWDRQGNHPP